MKLYFSPGACSLSPHIALREADADFELEQVDLRSKQTKSGGDFRKVNPKGMVPVLLLDSGDTLTEGPAIVQYIADQNPASGIAPPQGSIARYHLMEWLNFITSELHKVVFIPLLDAKAPEGAKAFAREKAGPRLAYLNDYLDGKDYLLDGFTVADAYLVTVLNWAKPSGIELAEFPAIDAYVRRQHQRPSVAKAFAEELDLYKAEQARRAPPILSRRPA
jgi:glutathione S-transferase